MTDFPFQGMLEQLNLTQYASALKEGGYDDLQSMISDVEENAEELKAELVNEVGMKKPHSRKLLRHLNSLSQLPVAAQPPPVPAASNLNTKVACTLVPQNEVDKKKSSSSFARSVGSANGNILSIHSPTSTYSGMLFNCSVSGETISTRYPFIFRHPNKQFIQKLAYPTHAQDSGTVSLQRYDTSTFSQIEWPFTFSTSKNISIIVVPEFFEYVTHGDENIFQAWYCIQIL